MTPRTMALAYRIWAYATPREWDVSVKEVAEALGVSWQHVNLICAKRGWNARMRKDTTDAGLQIGRFTPNSLIIAADDYLEGHWL